MLNEKVCKGCHKVLPLDNFTNRSDTPSGKRARCKECTRSSCRNYYKKNSETVKERVSEWYQNNKDKARKTQLQWANKEYETNPKYRVAQLLRSRLRSTIKNKRKSALELVGCSIDELMDHLESQFTEGMTWDNQGAWHIDHIKPCASFDLTKISEQKKCFHYTNLQPLWAKDNLRKGDRYV